MIPTRRTVFSHLQIGDALVSNGICRTLAKDGKPLEWFTGEGALRIVRRMFSDLPNVRCWWLQNYEEFPRRWKGRCPGALCLGYFAPEGDLFKPEKWDREFYRQAGLSFDLRWEAFDLPKDLLGPDPVPRRAILWHQDPQRGYNIDLRRVPHPEGYDVWGITPDRPFWDWLPLVRAAEELHFIDSAFLNLAESLWFKGWLSARRLVYHAYARPTATPILRGPWEVLR